MVIDTKPWLRSSWGPRIDRRSGHLSPFITQKLVPLDNYLQMKNSPPVQETTLKGAQAAYPTIDGQ